LLAAERAAVSGDDAGCVATIPCCSISGLESAAEAVKDGSLTQCPSEKQISEARAEKESVKRNKRLTTENRIKLPPDHLTLTVFYRIFQKLLAADQ
jgi:hypothetical protein